MSSIAVAAGIMGGLGLFFAVLLTVAWFLLRVEEDPRIDLVEEALPGSNCGACGQAGCRAFAEKLVEGALAPSACTVSSPDGVAHVADLLGVDAGEAVKRVARLHCAGGRSQSLRIAEYQGHLTCSAAALVSGAGKACPWGCLGLGDCDVACSFDAIHMSSEDLPVVDPDRCTACGDCVDACPKDLFQILPLDTKVLVQCSAPLAGEAATAVCRVACDACGRCAADAPDLIQMINGLPVVDADPTAPHRAAAVARCPTGAIQFLEGAQFPNLASDRRRHVAAG